MLCNIFQYQLITLFLSKLSLATYFSVLSREWNFNAKFHGLFNMINLHGLANSGANLVKIEVEPYFDNPTNSFKLIKIKPDFGGLLYTNDNSDDRKMSIPNETLLLSM